MTREEAMARLPAAAEASHTTDALLHMLQLAAWDMANKLCTGEPVTMEAVNLAQSIDRTIEAARNSHKIEIEVLWEADFHFASKAVSK